MILEAIELILYVIISTKSLRAIGNPLITTTQKY
jgi:hypothetical protein